MIDESKAGKNSKCRNLSHWRSQETPSMEYMKETAMCLEHRGKDQMSIPHLSPYKALHS